jgi:Mrp family chromosome partitioning ATPase
MTALDQAFIRAYSQQSATSPTLLLAPGRPTVPLSEALGEPTPPNPLVWSAKVTLDGLLAGLQKTSQTAAPEANDEASALPAPPAPEAALPQPAHCTTGAGCGENEEGGDACAADWHPMLQVDRFAWPKICERLNAEAAGPIDQLTDALIALVREGRGVLGLGSCSQGEGVTTLTMAVGRRMVERGLRVALVDANWSDPQLAQRLGLLPQVGWDETLAGRLPLEEVAVESIEDRLVVLPVCTPCEVDTDDEKRVAATLDTLSKHFDVVLVDLGGLEDRDKVATPPARAVDACLTGVVLVHNVRLVTPDRLADFRRSLTAARMVAVGVVENFVAPNG